MLYTTLYLTFVYSKELIAYLETLIYFALFYRALRADGYIDFHTSTTLTVQRQVAPVVQEKARRVVEPREFEWFYAQEQDRFGDGGNHSGDCTSSEAESEEDIPAKTAHST